MPSDIDSLQIKITAQAKDASSSINRLIGNLNSLSSSLGKVSKNNFRGLTDGVRSLSSAMKDFGQENISGFASIANATKKLNEIDTGKIRELSSSLSVLSSGLKDIGGVSFNAEGLNSIANSMRGFGSKGSIAGAENLSRIQSSLSAFVRGINEVGSLSFDPSSLSELFSSISKLGGKYATQASENLPKISGELKRFVSEMNALKSVSFDVSGLAELVSSISKLGGKSVKNAIENIPKLTSAMQKLMNELSRAPTVSRNIIDMTNALANLARTGSGTGRAAGSISNSLKMYTDSTAKASRGSKGLASALGKIYATYWLVFRGIGKLGDAMDISSQLTEVQNVVDVTFGEFKQKLEDFSATSITDFGISEMTAKKTASRFQAMGTSMGIARGAMADMSIELTKLTADMASFYDEDQSDVARRMWSVFSGETEPLRRYGLDLTQATLAEWAMKQGLDANIQSMTQAEKTMLRYQYVMANSTAASGDFARTQGMKSAA